MEISEYDFTIHHLQGTLNTAADALSRISSLSVNDTNLIRQRHEQYGHPGITRLMKIIQSSDEG